MPQVESIVGFAKIKEIKTMAKKNPTAICSGNDNDTGRPIRGDVVHRRDGSTHNPRTGQKWQGVIKPEKRRHHWKVLETRVTNRTKNFAVEIIQCTLCEKKWEREVHILF